MKYLYSWIRDYYKAESSVQETAETLVGLGSEVENDDFADIDENIIAVKITKIEPHPNADRLRLATVSDGGEEVRIVCGAPNIEVGQIVPMAKVGSKIGGVEITEVEIRGVKSVGMLCSDRELGLGDDHTGIRILPCEVKSGTKIKDYLKADVVLDLEITPNRGDLLSHYGIARDLSAKSGKIISKEDISLSEGGGKATDAITVDSKTKLCPLYLARVIKGVKIAPSPDWLQARLVGVGTKPINNVVDVTNYIMLDLGHPMHAFDASKIACNKIEIREIKKDTDVITLDGEARVLLSGMMVIADGERPVAIAGVMGLQNSEVEAGTADIILEAAVFDRKSIRKTRRLLGIQTEASYRFERGVDEAGVQYAIDKAAKLIQEIAGGEILEGIVQAGDVKSRKEIAIEHEKIGSLLGFSIAEGRINEILVSLGFEIVGDRVLVPLWRHDIEIWQDLAEEVGRIQGLEKIEPIELPRGDFAKKFDFYKKEMIKDYLVDLGLDETINYTFLSEPDVSAAQIDASNLAEVENPVQEENRYLRNSLVPGLLKAISRNPSFDDIEIFEIGKVFSKDEEWTSFAIACAGRGARKAGEIVQRVCEKFQLAREDFDIFEISGFDLGRFKVKKPTVYIAEVNLDVVFGKNELKAGDLNRDSSVVNYRPISKFPPVKRDLAFVVNVGVSADDIRGEIKNVSSKAILVELFDEFISDKLGNDKKSVAFHVWLEDEEKTLQDNEAEQEVKKIIDALGKKFGAELRN